MDKELLPSMVYTVNKKDLCLDSAEIVNLLLCKE